MNFYFRAGYSIDSNSPSMLQMNVPYDILSKILIWVLCWTTGALKQAYLFLPLLRLPKNRIDAMPNKHFSELSKLAKTLVVY